MKYVKILILGVERGLLRSSRLGVSLVVPSGTDISGLWIFHFWFLLRFVLSGLFLFNEAPCIISTNHGRLCERSSTRFNISQGSSKELLFVNFIRNKFYVHCYWKTGMQNNIGYHWPIVMQAAISSCKRKLKQQNDLKLWSLLDLEPSWISGPFF